MQLKQKITNSLNRNSVVSLPSLQESKEDIEKKLKRIYDEENKLQAIYSHSYKSMIDS